MSNTDQHHSELADLFTGVSQTINDTRLYQTRNVHTAYTFPGYTKAEWIAKAAELREHILVSNGLTPMPEKTPLNAHVFGRIEREDYSVEKVYFEAYPGFFTTGNLYRPKGKKDRFRGSSVHMDTGAGDGWRTAKRVRCPVVVSTSPSGAT